jgi:hypothetical protein
LWLCFPSQSLQSFCLTFFLKSDELNELSTWSWPTFQFHFINYLNFYRYIYKLCKHVFYATLLNVSLIFTIYTSQIMCLRWWRIWPHVNWGQVEVSIDDLMTK